MRFSLTGFLLLSLFCSAQRDSTLSLQSLDMPSSPAFILLDQAPTCIERPSNGKAFLLGIVNSLVDNQGLPKNYSVEITPFWYFKHPRLNALKFMGYDKQKGKQQVFSGLRMTSLSAAYLQIQDTATLYRADNFSFGLRSTIFTVKSKKDIEAIIKANKQHIKYLRSLNVLMAERGINDSLYDVNKKEYKRKLTELLEERVNDSIFTNNVFPELLSRKPVFSVSVALAYNTFFTSASYDSSHFGRMGGWITMNYSKPLNKENSGNYINIYAVGRYLSDGTARMLGEFFTQELLDLGWKFELEFRKLAISYEYLYRKSDIAETYRSSGNVRFRVSDQLILNGSFGKNFGHEQNLITLLGLQWGLSTGNEKVGLN